ncbi:MAG: GNAT family N-acetyltransferase [Halioglobus sp.]|nr:GNAT family N-acetyltransferase [Halioglobus sp.]
MPESIGTERLLLRPLDADDLDALHVLWTERRFRHFLWDGEIIARDLTAQIIAKNSQLFAAGDVGIWGVRERGADALLGIAGFWEFHAPPVRELLFGVAPARWNGGVATEAARAVVDTGFASAGFDAIQGSCDRDNRASVRVMEKLGMQRRRGHRPGQGAIEFYGLTRARWHASGQ